MVNVLISSTANQGKSTIALIIEDALQKAGIPFLYEEDDLEMEERSTEFVARTEKNIIENKIKDYGIKVKLSTMQLQRDCIKDDD